MLRLKAAMGQSLGKCKGIQALGALLGLCCRKFTSHKCTFKKHGDGRIQSAPFCTDLSQVPLAPNFKLQAPVEIIATLLSEDSDLVDTGAEQAFGICVGRRALL